LSYQEHISRRGPARGATLRNVLVAAGLTSWNADPLQLAPILAVSYLYARRARSLSRRSLPVPAWRQFLFWLGIGLLLLALVTPIEALGEEDFFFMHMTQHVLIGDLAPLCFAAGLTGPILRPVLAIRFFDRLRFLTNPLVALPLWGINLYVWHVPFLYEAALGHDAVHALEHFMFFTAGFLMWSPVVETLPAPAWSRPRSATCSSGPPRSSTPRTRTACRNGGSVPCRTRTSPGS